MHRTALLEFGNPDVAAPHAPTLAPPAELPETVRKVTGLPVVNAPVRERYEPDVFAMPRKGAKSLEVTTRPDGATKATYPPQLSGFKAELNVKRVLSTCFRWDKPSSLRRARRALRRIRARRMLLCRGRGTKR